MEKRTIYGEQQTEGVLVMMSPPEQKTLLTVLESIDKAFTEDENKSFTTREGFQITLTPTELLQLKTIIQKVKG